MLRTYSIESLLHIGWNCFPEGHTYNRGVAFVIANIPEKKAKSRYVSVSDVAATVDKESLFLQRLKTGISCYSIDPKDFNKLPSHLIAYWLSTKVREILSGKNLSDLGQTKRGLQPGDVTTMVRAWWEVSADKTELAASTRGASIKSSKRWFKFDSGGPFRKWYGNNLLVVDWEDSGKRIRSGTNPIVPSEHLYFEPGFVWSKVTSSFPSFRLHDGGTINGDASPCFFPRSRNIALLGLFNSACTRHFLLALSPTLNFQVSDILNLPKCSITSEMAIAAQDAVLLARIDWDNFETSWDFRDLPLLREGTKRATLATSWQQWQAQCAVALHRMQELETENNRLFIAAYGLQDELQPEVAEEQITLTRADARRDMVAFLSYGVGCMMGRFSIDKPGTILGNAGETLREFLQKVGKPLEALTFAPAAAGIVPVLDGDWFEDDIVGRVREFLGVAFGEQTLEQNVAFLEDALGKDLRKYFLTDFYKDHLQIYKKRPIYWLFQSPQKQFRALVYLHRYTRDTVNTMLNGYLREFHHKLTARIRDLQHTLESESVTPRDKTRAQKELDKVQKARADAELYEREILLPLAQKRLEIDLDDGVKANYPKFGLALAPIAGMTDEED